MEDFETASRLDLEESDPYDLPVAVSRLNALLLAAEERKEKLESTSARLLSINRGGFFRGRKSYYFFNFLTVLFK